ncbi:hypothetical protein [Streptomyces sp. NPDC013455]|uniref:hypothetical protein n=1 Tax=Streptomyces sp. NPDC013455 TaxID=3155605 RepID=UPI0033C5AAB4
MSARDELRRYVRLLADAWTPREQTDARVERLYLLVRTEVLHEGAAELDRMANETEARVAAHYGPASGIGPGSADLVREAARTLRSMAEGKSSRPAADVTPGLTARQERLLDAIRTHGGPWTTARVLSLYQLIAPGVVQRGTARRDLTALHRAGHLVLVDDPDNRHYVLRRKDR